MGRLIRAATQRRLLPQDLVTLVQTLQQPAKPTRSSAKSTRPMQVDLQSAFRALDRLQASFARWIVMSGGPRTRPRYHAQTIMIAFGSATTILRAADRLKDAQPRKPLLALPALKSGVARGKL